MADSYDQLIRDNNLNDKGPKIQTLIPNIVEMYTEGYNLIHSHNLRKYMNINTMTLESYNTNDSIFFYGAIGVKLSLLNMYKISQVG